MNPCPHSSWRDIVKYTVIKKSPEVVRSTQTTLGNQEIVRLAVGGRGKVFQAKGTAYSKTSFAVTSQFLTEILKIQSKMKEKERRKERM